MLLLSVRMKSLKLAIPTLLCTPPVLRCYDSVKSSFASVQAIRARPSLLCRAVLLEWLCWECDFVMGHPLIKTVAFREYLPFLIEEVLAA